MSTGFAIQTLIELGVSILLIIGFIYEDTVIAFEQNIGKWFRTCKRIVVGNYRRWKRLRKHK